MEQPCLLVIDVQQALIDEGPADRDVFLTRLRTLLAEARRRAIPIAHVQHCDAPGGDLEPETAGWRIHPSVAPAASEPVFQKRYNSAFKETNLEAWLRERSITSLTMVGMQTEHCIDATVKSAFERGFHVTIPSGAHTTFDNGTLTAGQIRDFYQNRIWQGRYAVCEPWPEEGAAWFDRFFKSGPANGSPQF